MSQLALCHPTDRMDEITMVKIFKPVLVWIVSVGMTVEIMSRRVFDSVLIMSILWNHQDTWYNKYGKTYTVFLLIKHKWGYGPTGIGTITSLALNMNSSTADTEMVDSARDGMRRRRRH